MCSVVVCVRPRICTDHTFVDNAQVINQVGAVDLQATVNCERFASAHKAESHFDRQTSALRLGQPPYRHGCHFTV